MIGSVQLVLVLYRCLPEDSRTFRTLAAHRDALPGRVSSLLLYDNTEAVQRYEESSLTSRMGIPVVCRRNPANPGLAAAYNEGVRCAWNAGLDWLILLDQDTGITRRYLEAVAEGLDRYAADLPVAALVPRIRDARTGRWISPARVIGGNLQIPVPSVSARSRARFTAVNSGTAVRAEFIRGQGGYPASLPLDMLDHWFCYQVFRHGRRMAGLDAVLEHDLSVSRMRDVDPARAAGIFSAERLFYRRYARFGHRLLYRIRILGRLIKYSVLPGNAPARQALIRSALRRVPR